MRHHYIPQFLLRAWAEATADKKIETFRLDLPKAPSSRHAPKYVAYEEDLYSLTMDRVAGMDRQAVETHLLRHIDDHAARVLRKLIATGFKSMTHEDRCDWARFLMSLRLRQPHIVQKLRTESSEFLEASLDECPEEYNAIVGNGYPSTMSEWTMDNFPGVIENVGMSMFSGIVDDQEIGSKILKLKWWLWDFSGQQNELLLSDHPCIFTKGIDDIDLVIALPISPRKAFLATKSVRVATIMRRQRPRDLLLRMNESSVNQARTRIYASDAAPSRFIRNRLAKRTAIT